MTKQTIAVMSPGAMGQAVGNVLRHGGARVITSLRGRSAATAARAAAAGIADASDDEVLVREAGVLLSIVAPAEAYALAERIGTAVRATGARLLYVDCNAVAPHTAREISALLTAAGARFVDASIVGGPPEIGGAGPRFYASGAAAPDFARAVEGSLDARVLGPEIGQASGLKMCYAALTKGLTALATELLVAGRVLGLADALEAELEASQRPLLDWIDRQVAGMPSKAARWVAEMEEIAATFGSLGLTPRMLEGAADLYRFVATTPVAADATPAENREAVIAGLATAAHCDASLPSRRGRDGTVPRSSPR
jgi:3-hydroxyisobutyrate dehydrogenase-like beta-hydroxyacid dehydrogenase